MPPSLSDMVAHIIFGTKNRQPLITAACKPDLMAYIGGIVREMNGYPLIVNGTEDQVHLLLGIPPRLSVAEVVRVVKTNSSRWMHQKGGTHLSFGWQRGYASFSVSRSIVPQVITYIQNQEEHHRRVSFQEEYLAFLKKHGVRMIPDMFGIKHVCDSFAASRLGNVGCPFPMAHAIG